MRLLTKIADLLEKTLSQVSYRVCNLGVIVLVGMVLLVVTDITLRRCFNSPFSWSLEVVEVMLSVVVFFAVAYTASQRSHVSIDVLTSRLPPRAQTIIDTVIYFISTGLFSIIAWRTLVYGIHLWKIGLETGVLGIPYYPFVFVVAFGCILLALVLLAQFLYLIIEVASK